METGARGWGWIGRLRPRTFDRVLVAILFLLGLTSLIDLRFGDRPLPLPIGTPGGAVTVPGLFFVAAWLIGDYLRTRRAYVAQLEERAARLERERDQDRRLAADEERTRIARELHDVVAHDVSVIAIQAGAARAVQLSKPVAAAQALGLIETTARETLIELNRLPGVLRGSNGATPDRSPQPGIGHLAGLVEELRAAGLEVDA